MYNIKLYDLILSGNITDSIHYTTEILLSNNSSIELFNNTIIFVISYIGSYISIFDISKWHNVINDTKNIINDDNIVIKNIYILIAKLCILCNIYNKNPITKTGVINLKLLRTKIISNFENNKTKVSQNGLNTFENIIPPLDSDAYNISIAIINGLINIINETNDISFEDGDKLNDISNKLRNCFDYIIRKKYNIETKFYRSDNNVIWFLWGFISILYNEDFIDNTYWLFNYNSKKKYNNKFGLLWGCAISLIYSHKKNISTGWNTKEQDAINKIDELSIQLFNKIKKDLISENEDEYDIKEKYEKVNNNLDGIDYISNYKPTVKYTHNQQEDDYNSHNQKTYSTKNLKIKSSKNKFL